MVPYLNDMPTSDYACPAPALPVGIAPPVVGNEAGEAGEREEGNVGDQPPDAGQPGSEVGVGVGPQGRGDIPETFNDPFPEEPPLHCLPEGQDDHGSCSEDVPPGTRTTGFR